MQNYDFFKRDSINEANSIRAGLLKKIYEDPEFNDFSDEDDLENVEISKIKIF